MEAQLAGRLLVDVLGLVDPHKPGPSDVVSKADGGQAQRHLALGADRELRHPQVERHHQVFLPANKINKIQFFLLASTFTWQLDIAGQSVKVCEAGRPPA